MNKTLSLMGLVNRIKFDQEQIKNHPEKSEKNVIPYTRRVS